MYTTKGIENIMKSRTFIKILALALTLTLAVSLLPLGGLVVFAETITITFYADGVYVPPVEDLQSGSLIPKPQDPVMENYLFLGWFDSFGAEEWDFSVPALSSMELYAKWGYWEEEFAAGDGKTAQTAFEIHNAKQLNHIRSHTETGTYFKLMSDIDLSLWNKTSTDAAYTDGKGWLPIGDTATSVFDGRFDGNNKVIKNITINRTTLDGVGLFGVTGNTAEIKNLGIVSGSITGRKYVGAVAGSGAAGIAGCYNTANVTGKMYVGGIIGSNITGAAQYGYIKSCYNTGSIVADGTVSNLRSYAGGIVGDNLNTVSNCYNAGSVSSAYANAGGIAGGNFGVIKNSYNTGNVTAANKNAGGVSAENNGYLTSCFNTGNIAGSASVGSITGVNTMDMEEGISDCYRYRLALVNNSLIAASDQYSYTDSLHGGIKDITNMWEKSTYTNAGWGMDGTGDGAWVWDEGYTYPRLSGLSGQAYPFNIFFDVTPKEQSTTVNRLTVTLTPHSKVTDIQWTASTSSVPPVSGFASVSGQIDLPNGVSYLHLKGTFDGRVVTGMFGTYDISKDTTIPTFAGSGVTIENVVVSTVGKTTLTADVVVQSGKTAIAYLVKYKGGKVIDIASMSVSASINLSVSTAGAGEEIYLMVWDANMQPIIEKYQVF